MINENEVTGDYEVSKETTYIGRFLIVWMGQLISSIGSVLTAFSPGVYA